MRKALLFLSVSLISLIACKKENTVATVDCSTSKSFATDASPVFQSSCSYSTGCHATGSSKGVFVTYQQIYNSRNTIRSAVMNGSMPEGKSLSSAELSAIVCWIDAGAANN